MQNSQQLFCISMYRIWIVCMLLPANRRDEDFPTPHDSISFVKDESPFLHKYCHHITIQLCIHSMFLKIVCSMRNVLPIIWRIWTGLALIFLFHSQRAQSTLCLAPPLILALRQSFAFIFLVIYSFSFAVLSYIHFSFQSTLSSFCLVCPVSFPFWYLSQWARLILTATGLVLILRCLPLLYPNLGPIFLSFLWIASRSYLRSVSVRCRVNHAVNRRKGVSKNSAPEDLSSCLLRA